MLSSAIGNDKCSKIGEKEYIKNSNNRAVKKTKDNTQKEVETTEDWSDFEITIRPTADFFSPLLSRGPLIQVMEQQWLADEIKRQHEELTLMKIIEILFGKVLEYFPSLKNFQKNHPSQKCVERTFDFLSLVTD